MSNIQVKLPKLGEDVDTGVIASLLVEPGDEVEREQPLLEIESDKATTEMPSPVAGTVEDIQVSVGEEVESGQTVMVVTAADGSEDDGSDAETQGSPEEEVAEESVDDRDERDERADQTDHDDQPDAGGEAREAAEAAPEAEEKRSPEATSPEVRGLARELGIDLTRVDGRGPVGDVTREDLLAHVRARLDHDVEGVEADAAHGAEHAIRTPLSDVRRATARSVTRSWARVVHVTQCDEADVTQLAERLAESEAEASLLAAIVSMTARALRRFPLLNGKLEEGGEAIVVDSGVHIGVAVDTSRGLYLPVISDVDRLGLVELTQKIAEMAEQARAAELDAQSLEGASFSVSNLGGFGTTYFTPIVPWPQLGILGVGKATRRPVWNGQTRRFDPALVLPLSLSYDHRAVDGVYAARFLRWLAVGLESPAQLFI